MERLNPEGSSRGLYTEFPDKGSIRWRTAIAGFSLLAFGGLAIGLGCSIDQNQTSAAEGAIDFFINHSQILERTPDAINLAARVSGKFYPFTDMIRNFFIITTGVASSAGGLYLSYKSGFLK